MVSDFLTGRRETEHSMEDLKIEAVSLREQMWYY